MFTTRKAVSVLFAAVAVAGLGCGGSVATDPGIGKRVEITIARDAYVPGDSVVTTIRNVSGVTLYYFFCPAALQRYENGTWTAVSPPPTACTMELPFLAAGQSRVFVYHLRPDMAAGVYRISLPAPGPGGQRTGGPDPDVTTPQFTVSAGASATP